MTVSNDTPQRVTLVAVDIAKNSHDVLIESPTRGRRRRLRLANNLEDFEQLAGYLRSLKSSVLIGFEATGNYHRPLAYFLHRQGFELELPRFGRRCWAAVQSLVTISFLVVNGRQIIDRGMAAVRVIPSFNKLEGRHACFDLGFETAPVKQLALEGGKETLAHGVVETVAD